MKDRLEKIIVRINHLIRFMEIEEKEIGKNRVEKLLYFKEWLEDIIKEMKNEKTYM